MLLLALETGEAQEYRRPRSSSMSVNAAFDSRVFVESAPATVADPA